MVIRAQRTDLSPYLVHLTRADTGHEDARENLLQILTDGVIEARTAYGIGIAHIQRQDDYGEDFVEEATESQRVVCFTETPLDELSSHLQPSRWGSDFDFRPYGLAFSRQYMMEQGANPVWYLNCESGPGISFKWLAKSVWQLVRKAATNDSEEPDAERFNSSQIAHLTPFMEMMGQWGRSRRDFSYEREWRYQGDFRFGYLEEPAAVIVPTGQSESFREQMRDDVPYPDTWINTLDFRELDARDLD